MAGLQNRRVDVMDEGDAKEFLLELCPRIGEKAPKLAKNCVLLPLALRIAGSFLQVNSDWSIESYIDKLADRKTRLEMLKTSHEGAELAAEPELVATFDLSYRQLAEDDRKRWRMLGVFPASFAATAAQAMWEIEESETITSLGLFKRYSLLEYDEISSRFRLHDLMTDYALAQMNDAEKAAARVLFAAHYSSVLGELNKLFLKGGNNLLVALKLYDVERENIEVGQRNATLYLEEDQNAAQACNWYAWQGSINNLRLLARDQIKWIEDGLRASKVLKNKEAEGAHLGNLGNAYAALGDARKAIEFYEQRMEIAREIGDRRGEGNALGNLGNTLYGMGEKDKGIDLMKQALAIFEAIESPNAVWARNKFKEWGMGE